MHLLHLAGRTMILLRQGKSGVLTALKRGLLGPEVLNLLEMIFLSKKLFTLDSQLIYLRLDRLCSWLSWILIGCLHMCFWVFLIKTGFLSRRAVGFAWTRFDCGYAITIWGSVALQGVGGEVLFAIDVLRIFAFFSLFRIVFLHRALFGIWSEILLYFEGVTSGWHRLTKKRLEPWSPVRLVTIWGQLGSVLCLKVSTRFLRFVDHRL